MSERVIPPGVRRDLESLDNPHVLLAFMTISHPNLAEDVRLVSDAFNYEWNGEIWQGLVFGFGIVTDNEGFPRTEITLSNVDRRISQILRNTQERARLSLQVISSSEFQKRFNPRIPWRDPPVVYEYNHFEVVNAKVNAVEATARLMIRDYSQEPWPSQRATQDRLPGLFR